MNENLYKEVANLFPRDLCETCYYHQSGNYTKEDCVTYGKRLCRRERTMFDRLGRILKDAGYLHKSQLEPVTLEGLTEEELIIECEQPQCGLGGNRQRNHLIAANKVVQATLSKIQQQGKLWRLRE